MKDGSSESAQSVVRPQVGRPVLSAVSPSSTPAVGRVPRDRRNKGVRVRLTERDERLLKALARFRIARTSDLLRLAFYDVRADTAARRLRRLFDAKYLDVQSGDRSLENVYALGPEGRAFARGLNLSALTRPRGQIDHHLATVRSWVNLTRIADTSLEVFRPDWEIRAYSPHDFLIPDALVQLRRDDRTLRFALEVDMGTESMRTLKAKVDHYSQRTDFFGWKDFGVCFVLGGHGRGRFNVIKKMLEERCARWHLLWSVDDEPPLTASPCRKGSESAVTA